ncbi:MAG: hypothetical protein R3B70_03350 [Polyangiaceae bacterium]
MTKPNKVPGKVHVAVYLDPETRDRLQRARVSGSGIKTLSEVAREALIAGLPTVETPIRHPAPVL